LQSESLPQELSQLFGDSVGVKVGLGWEQRVFTSSLVSTHQLASAGSGIRHLGLPIKQHGLRVHPTVSGGIIEISAARLVKRVPLITRASPAEIPATVARRNRAAIIGV